MGRRLAAALVVLAACKAELAGTRDDADLQPDTGPAVDASTMGADVLLLGAWGTPQPITGASDVTLAEDDSTLSSDALELVFKRNDAGDPNLYVMTRASTTAPFSAPTAIAALNTTVAEESPRMSADDLTLYFGRDGDIYKSTRAVAGGAWGAPAAVTALNTAAYEKWAAICPGGYAVVSRAVTGNGQDLFEGTEAGGAPTALTAVNSASNEQGSFITSDCLHMYFQSDRGGDFDLYETQRATASAAWPAPTKLADFNATTTVEEDPWISGDQRTFVYASNKGGTKDVYIVTR